MMVARRQRQEPQTNLLQRDGPVRLKQRKHGMRGSFLVVLGTMGGRFMTQVFEYAQGREGHLLSFILQ